MGLKEYGWTDVPIVAMETEGAHCFNLSMHANKKIVLNQISSIAVTLGAASVCDELMRLKDDFKIIFLHLSLISFQIVGNNFNEAAQAALREVDEPRVSFIHAYDHPDIWEGHTSLVQELVYSSPKPSCIITAVGGGGLLTGILMGLKEYGNKLRPESEERRI
ncbi:L-serine dehydratase/L-threonine deaminase-like [Diaphorina citri]|uniref:L-serine ammonia-lyase n=1 Tax=Diaphorina citri TaxID=121845 RepID=A0A1S4EQP3_DIACI|nr:L-serine dehydratase/L-threonine deaminase-like [Diaphorina citri]